MLHISHLVIQSSRLLRHVIRSEISLVVSRPFRSMSSTYSDLFTSFELGPGAGFAVHSRHESRSAVCLLDATTRGASHKWTRSSPHFGSICTHSQQICARSETVMVAREGELHAHTRTFKGPGSESVPKQLGIRTLASREDCQAYCTHAKDVAYLLLDLRSARQYVYDVLPQTRTRIMPTTFKLKLLKDQTECCTAHVVRGATS